MSPMRKTSFGRTSSTNSSEAYRFDEADRNRLEPGSIRVAPQSDIIDGWEVRKPGERRKGRKEKAPSRSSAAKRSGRKKAARIRFRSRKELPSIARLPDRRPPMRETSCWKELEARRSNELPGRTARSVSSRMNEYEGDQLSRRKCAPETGSQRL